VPNLHADKTSYLANMAKQGVFGGNPEIKAMAEIYNKVIVVHQQGIPPLPHYPEPNNALAESIRSTSTTNATGVWHFIFYPDRKHYECLTTAPMCIPAAAMGTANTGTPQGRQVSIDTVRQLAGNANYFVSEIPMHVGGGETGPTHIAPGGTWALRPLGNKSMHCGSGHWLSCMHDGVLHGSCVYMSSHMFARVLHLAPNKPFSHPLHSPFAGRTMCWTGGASYQSRYGGCLKLHHDPGPGEAGEWPPNK